LPRTAGTGPATAYARSVAVEDFGADETAATDAYSRLEREVGDHREVEVVLVGADSRRREVVSVEQWAESRRGLGPYGVEHVMRLVASARPL